MKSLTGFLKKTLLLLSSVISIFVIDTAAYAADSDVAASVDLTYIFDLEDLEIQFDFQVRNKSSYPSVLNYYTLSLPFTNISQVAFIVDGEIIQANTYDKDYGTDIILDLNSEVVRSDKPVQFSGTVFVEDFISQSNQSTRKVLLPTEISSNISTESVEISYDSEFGEPQYLSLNYSKLQKIQDYYNITISDIGNSKQLSLIFGDSVAYDFSINKTVANNDSSRYRVFDIALPKHQHNQLISIKSVEPLPDTSYMDADSNIFLSYNIPPNKALDIKIDGTISFNYNWQGDSYETLGLEVRSDLTETEKYWDINDDSEIDRFELYAQKRGLDLSSSIQEADIELFQRIAYDYVVDRLTINELSTSGEDFTAVHGGAQTAISRRDEAIPEDYSDLLIAILRKYNIPSRMSIGYVVPGEFSENGFFHYWVECWQNDKGWVIFDPALDDLLTSTDYFGKETYDHITILTRGSSSLKPKLPITAIHEYTFVPAENDFIAKTDFETQFSFEEISASDNTAVGSVVIKNTGTALLKDFEVADSPGLNLFYFNNVLLVPGQQLEIPISYKLPESNAAISTNDEGITLSGTVSIHNLLGQREQQEYETQIDFISYWWWPLFLKLASLLVFLAFLALLFTLHRVYVRVRGMRRNRTSRNLILVLTIGLLACATIFIHSHAYAQAAEVNVELGTQSVWDKKIPIIVNFTPKISSNNTEISWDVPAGINLIENHNKFIETEAEKEYTVTAFADPINSGEYRVVVNITSWAQTNYTTSESVVFSVNESLVVTPPTQGYNMMLIVKYGIFAFVGVVTIAVIGFGGKFVADWAKKYFAPPEI